MSRLINKVTAPVKKFHGKIIAIGHGKSAYLFAAATPCDTSFTILTEHKTKQSFVESIWRENNLHPISQSDSIAEIEQQILSTKAGEPITFICSTNPQRFRYWLDLLLPKIPLTKKCDVIFFLPQSPNFEFENLAALGFTAILLDYYPGIGGAKHNPTNGISQITAGVKEEIWFTLANSENFLKRQEILVNNLQHLTLNQKLEFEKDHRKFFLTPTNAILHMVGNITHIAAALVEKGVLDPATLTAKTPEEFFEKFDQDVSSLTKDEIIAAIGDVLKGRGFYRQMPSIGPDILMTKTSWEIGKIIAVMKDGGDLQNSDFDKLQNIASHLVSKYEKQWEVANDKDPRLVRLSEFIRQNPPYQNKEITVPTEENGKIKTSNSRFYSEEIPTLKWILHLADEQGILNDELLVVRNLVAFGEKMMIEKN